MITTLLENYEQSPFDENFWEIFPFGFTSLGPFEDTVSKDCILNCIFAHSLRDSDEKGRNSKVSAVLQNCMIDEIHRGYEFLDIDFAIFSKEEAWLCRTRAALVQLSCIPASADMNWGLRLAMVDSSVAFQYFSAHDGELKHPKDLVQETLAKAWAFPRVFFENLRASFLLPREAQAELYAIVYKSLSVERAMGSNNAKDFCRLICRGIEGSVPRRTGTEGSQAIRQRRSYSLTLWKKMVISWGQKEKSCFACLISMRRLY